MVIRYTILWSQQLGSLRTDFPCKFTCKTPTSTSTISQNWGGYTNFKAIWAFAVIIAANEILVAQTPYSIIQRDGVEQIRKCESQTIPQKIESLRALLLNSCCWWFSDFKCKLPEFFKSVTSEFARDVGFTLLLRSAGINHMNYHDFRASVSNDRMYICLFVCRCKYIHLIGMSSIQ